MNLFILILIQCQIINFAFADSGSENIGKLMSSINIFSENFFLTHLQETDNKAINFAFSPLSISQTFSMIVSSTRGDTQTELMNALGYKDILPSTKNIDDSYHTLLDQYSENEMKIREALTMDLISLALIDKDIKVTNEFMNVAGIKYNAEIRKFDFQQSLDSGIRGVNNFIKQKTHGHIEEILSPDIEGLDFVLANGMFFKGLWETSFEEKITIANFSNIDKTTSYVEMMSIRNMFSFYEDSNSQMIRIPYMGNASMIIHLPKQEESFVNFMKGKKPITIPSLKLLQSTKTKAVQLYLPKFKIRHSINLKDSFKKMGVSKLFDRYEADLSGMLSKDEGKVFIDEASSKSYLDVETAGAKAASGTIVDLRTQLFEMNCNRPFFYTIMDELNDLPLLMGAIRKF